MLKLRKCSWFFSLDNNPFQATFNFNVLVNFFCAETEHISLSHSQLAQSMREEAKKLEEFREKQKEARKKVCGCISIVVTEASC